MKKNRSLPKSETPKLPLHRNPAFIPVYQAAINRHPDRTPIIQVRNLRKVYRMGEERVIALDDVSLDIYKGEVVCILGRSGSGKSTFLNMLAGLEKPTRGTIKFGKISIENLSERDITYFRQRNIGFIFQAYNLLPTLTALENAAMPLNFKGVPTAERNRKAMHFLDKVGIGNLAKRKPAQMSGGQQQRVGIARALTAEPKIIFADEPTGNLDSRTTEDVLQLILKCVRENNQTLILVTHDPGLAKAADIVVTVSDGNIVKIEEKGKVLAALDA